MADREFEEHAFYHGNLPNTQTEIIPSVGDLSVIRSMRFINNGTSMATFSIWTADGGASAPDLRWFRDVEVEVGGYFEWRGWHVMKKNDTDDNYQAIWAISNGTISAFIDGAIMEIL